MQVDHLDLHPENSACFHSMWVIDQAGQRHLNKLRHPEKIAQVDIDKLLKIGFPNISTIMMRRALLSSYPEWFLDVATGDWTTAILCAKQGPLAYFRDIPMSIHRDRSKSCWLNRSLFERNLDEIHALETFDRYLQGEGHHGVIQQQINICEFWWVEIYYQLGQQIKARKAFWVAVHHWWRYRGVTVPQLLWYFLRAYFFGSVRLRARSQ